MKRTMDDLRDALNDEADGAASPDVEALVAGARRRVAAKTRRRGLMAFGGGAAAALVVGGLVANTLSTHQVLVQAAGPSSHSVIADHPDLGTKPSVNLVADGYHGRFRLTTTVVQSPGHAAQFCKDEVKISDAPECSTVDIVGWDWGHLKADSAERNVETGYVYPPGTKRGNYVLVGTFDGNQLTLTQPAVDAPPWNESAPAPQGSEFPETRCPKPTGGWRPVDPAKATDGAFDAALRRAKTESGFGQVWKDQPYVEGQTTTDPRKFVLNVSTTGDLAVMERKVRTVWGGSLCVSKTAHSAVQLSSVRDALMAKPLPGMQSASIGDAT
jgi:hypothetical protein